MTLAWKQEELWVLFEEGLACCSSPKEELIYSLLSLADWRIESCMKEADLSC